MAKILVAGEIPQKGLDLLVEKHEVEVHPSETLISEHIYDKDALLSLLSTPITKDIIDLAPNLKIIANYGLGLMMWILLNNEDSPLCSKRNYLK
ncbi:hypothetical protein FG382_15570 [Psychrobacillus lasiicapitis]|uniref:D-isomer specific 2-hydroxyacid dehydrogenase catalytic domain-containing protein n=1 Tax=Psychrobacillus lasiicapitis TaxID=1636719 RepID=A0A544T1N4_9BACI|nr:hypothetical protein FG382_15570 [Psychrobacillus lasiicapitis]GGA41166.1 hypothetical protein GCM10011384_33550 [Psychrobacillus lasiicapitis]